MGVLFAYLLGSFIAVFTFRNARARASVLFAADLLQTLPSFVYLIPIVMLFRVGDFAAVIAIAAYAIAPAMRYTLLGLANVPVPLQEAAAVSGCTKGQQLTKVEFPMAVPELLLGLNQTIMMGLAMVVISALLGTNDLGQETYTALALVDPGRGLVAGFAVSFIAIILDRMLSAAAADYRKKVIA
jgi:glycine betaine/proline transport system permease protein